MSDKYAVILCLICAAGVVALALNFRGCEADRQNIDARVADKCIASGGLWVSHDCVRCADVKP